jgi:pyrimidine operon attenuation protein/uracil phosphoribosyltransferase
LVAAPPGGADEPTTTFETGTDAADGPHDGPTVTGSVSTSARSVPEDGPDRPARTILAAADMSRVVDRVAHQILEKTSGAADTVLLGIPTRGVPLAHRLAARIRAFEGVDVPVGALDVTLYRDDLRLRGTRALARTDLPPGGVAGRLVILVDDVLFSGRTVRAALDAMNDLGRPGAVRLAVLVDRGHRELPIRADHVGKNLPSAQGQRVMVRLEESDGYDEVRIADVPGGVR